MQSFGRFQQNQAKTQPKPKPTPPPPQRIEPSPPPSRPATSAEAAKFLMQAGFNATDNDIETLQRIGYANWFENQVAMPVSKSAYQWLIDKNYDRFETINSVFGTDEFVYFQLMGTSDTLRKRIVLALSEFFVVSGNNQPFPPFNMAAYWDVLNKHAFGNFFNLLKDVTLTPGMGNYLNMLGSKKADSSGRMPDENYAREIMQLFTIGLNQLNMDGGEAYLNGKPIPAFTQRDVSQLARVFTGWTYDTTGSTKYGKYTRDWYKYYVTLRETRPMVLNADDHEFGASTFLGTTVPAGCTGMEALDRALRTLFNHSNVGPFFCRQMIQRLIKSNPSAGFVARVATIFNDNGSGVRGDLKAVFKAILLDREARGIPPQYPSQYSLPNNKMREFMIIFIQIIRTFETVSKTGMWVVDALTRMDIGNKAYPQSPLRSPSVFGFFPPNYRPPNTSIASKGLDAPEFFMANEATMAAYVNLFTHIIRYGYNDDNGIPRPAYTKELALVDKPTELLDRLSLLLCANQLSDTTKTTIITAIKTIPTNTQDGKVNRVCAAILMVICSPEYIIES